MDLNENTNWNEKNPDGTYKYNDDFLAEQLKKAGASGNKKTMEAITKAGEARFKEKYTQPTVQERQTMTSPVTPKTQAPSAQAPQTASPQPQTIPERTLKPQESGNTGASIGEASIGNADNSNARTYIEAKPDKIAELKNTYPDGYYENGKFYYNSENDEKRHELALEDIKENRDYTTAQAPSKHENDLKNKSGFDEKDYKGEYVYTEEELKRDLDKYGDSDKALAEAIKAELDRRDEESKAKPVEIKSEEVEEREGTVNNKSYDSVTEGKPVEMKADEENKKPKIDDKASREAYNTKADALNQAIDEAKERISDLDGMYDDLRKEAEAELDKHENAANLAEFLPKFAIQRYLEGEFGNLDSAKDKKKALGILGYFLIDKIGTGLINASLIARGMSPSQKSALQAYNEKRMTDALNRDNSNRAKINEEKINNIIKDSDALRQAGFDTEITLGNDMTSKYLQQHADQIDDKVYLMLMSEIGDWYENLPDSQKVVVRRAMLAMSTDPDANAKALLEDQLADVKLKAAQTEEEMENATYNKAYIREKKKYISSLAKTEQKTAEETLTKLIKENNLSDKQADMLIREIQSLEKDINWKDTEKAAGLVGGVISGILKKL